jgi:inosose dehydratase
MDPAIAARAKADDLPFGQAVAQGASVEPPAGLPDVPSVLEALSELDAEIFVVVEQDMYPVDFDLPLPIATRTRTYLNSAGLHSRPARER